jgi:hypothetical protein
MALVCYRLRSDRATWEEGSLMITFQRGVGGCLSTMVSQFRVAGFDIEMRDRRSHIRTRALTIEKHSSKEPITACQ